MYTKGPFGETFEDIILKIGLEICVWLKHELEMNRDIENSVKI